MSANYHHYYDSQERGRPTALAPPSTGNSPRFKSYTGKPSISSGLRFITCVVLFVLGNLSLGRRQGGLGWLWLWGRELQHPGARLMGAEGGIGVLGRAVQDEAPLFQFPWKAPDPDSPEGQEPPSGSP